MRESRHRAECRAPASPLALLTFTAALLLAPGATRAQCGKCSGTTALAAYRCGVDEIVCRMVGTNQPDPANPAECKEPACPFSFEVCREPKVTGPTVEVVDGGDGTLTARLTMDVRVPWNAVSRLRRRGSRASAPCRRRLPRDLEGLEEGDEVPRFAGDRGLL